MQEVDDAIKAAVRSDAQLMSLITDVFTEGDLPQMQPVPYLVINQVSDVNLYAHTGRIGPDLTYHVKARDFGQSYAGVEAIIDRCYRVLSDNQANVPWEMNSFTLRRCWEMARIGPVPADLNDVRFFQLIGVYRISLDDSL